MLPHVLWLLAAIAAFVAGRMLSRKSAAARPSGDTVAQGSDDIITLKSQLAGVRAELRTVNAVRDALAAEGERRERVLGEVKAQLTAIQRDYDKLGASNSKLVGERAKIALSSESVTQILKARETEHTDLTQQSARQKEEVENLRRSKTEATAALTEIQHRLNTTLSDMDALRQGRVNAEARLQAKERELADAHAALEKERARVLAFSSEIQRLSAEAISFTEFMRDLRKNDPAADKAQGEVQTKAIVAPIEENSAANASAVPPAGSKSAAGDDLRSVPGISRNVSRKLSAAGIRSFEELAGATPETLRDICPPVAGRPAPEYAKWIEKAAKLAASKSQAV